MAGLDTSLANLSTSWLPSVDLGLSTEGSFRLRVGSCWIQASRVLLAVRMPNDLQFGQALLEKSVGKSTPEKLQCASSSSRTADNIITIEAQMADPVLAPYVMYWQAHAHAPAD